MRYVSQSLGVLIAWGCLLTNSATSLTAQVNPVQDDPGQESLGVNFELDIKPILEKRCMRCHAAPDIREGIDLSYADAVIDSYVFAEDPDGSDFYQRMITDDPDIMMPPPDDGGPMPREEALLVRLWISEGAVWPQDVDLLSPQEGGAGGTSNENQSTDGAPRKIDFVKDVKPILEAHCLECHGSENPADGLDFSARDLVIGNYVMPGEPQSSSMHKRLVTDDPDKLMPPPEAGDPLTGAEALVIQLWIEEGAIWPEGETLGQVEEAAPVAKSLVGKAWTFQGYFHPATVHFPVALFTMAAVFVVMHWIFGGGFRDAAFYCLIFGAMSGVVASLMGWALSPAVGFGSNAFDSSSAVFWHRWCGVAVACGGIVVAVLAIRARRREKERRLERAKKDLPWQIGVMLLAMLVGLTGHQGGELTYGESWYEDAFAQFGSEDDSASESQDDDEDASSASDDASQDSVTDDQ